MVTLCLRVWVAKGIRFRVKKMTLNLTLVF